MSTVISQSNSSNDGRFNNDSVNEHNNDSFFDRLYTGEGGIDFIGRTKLWYGITVALLVISIAAIAIRGFALNIDFQGGTKLTMPAGDMVAEQVDQTFTDATGVKPEQTQIVGSGDSRTLEIESKHLSGEQAEKARVAISDKYKPLDSKGQANVDAIGVSNVSESWGSTITKRMILSMVVFLVLASIYVAVRLKKEMALAAMLALIVDGIVIAGFYALFGLTVSPAVVIGFLTVLTFSIYDTVIVFDKVNENTNGVFGSRRRTYAEQANLSVNQTVMRSASTSIISALPIIALLVVAVWLMGVGTLRDLALIQLIGVIEGVFSSLFLATPLLVTIMSKQKRVKEHNEAVAKFRAGHPDEDYAEEDEAEEHTPRTELKSENPAFLDKPVSAPREGRGESVTWRPGRN